MAVQNDSTGKDHWWQIKADLKLATLTEASQQGNSLGDHRIATTKRYVERKVSYGI